MGYHLNRLDERVFMEGPKPMDWGSGDTEVPSVEHLTIVLIWISRSGIRKAIFHDG